MIQQFKIFSSLALSLPLLACVSPQPQGEVGAGGEVYQSTQYPASESYPSSSYPAQSYPAQSYPSGAGGSTYGNSQGQTYYPPVNAPVSCQDCGVVEEIQVVQSQGKGSGLGAAAGAAAGGLLGAQFGGGAVNTAATVAGVAGGAYAGHQVEKKARSGEEYLIFVRMSSGRVNTYKQSDPPSYGVGSDVRVLNGRVVGR